MKDIFEFVPETVKERLKAKYPSMNNSGIDYAIKAFEQYVDICDKFKHKQIPMFSVVVDDVWHEMILHTQNYVNFCESYLGYFLHHNPTPKSDNPKFYVISDSELALWVMACLQEDLDPLRFNSCPKLFSVDIIFGKSPSHRTTRIVEELRKKDEMIQNEKTQSSVKSWMSKWYKTEKFNFVDDSGLDLQELLSYSRRDNLGYHNYSPVTYADTTKRENKQTEYVYMGDGMMMEVINTPVDTSKPIGRDHVESDSTYHVPAQTSSHDSTSHSSCGSSSSHSHSCSSHSSCSSSSCSSSSCSSSSCSN